MARLKAYRARLILFPRKADQPKPGDASKAETDAFAKEQQEAVRHLGAALPIVDDAKATAVTEIKASQMPKGEEAAYKKLRMARSDARLVGVREKRAKAKAEEAAAAKK